MPAFQLLNYNGCDVTRPVATEHVRNNYSLQVFYCQLQWLFTIQLTASISVISTALSTTRWVFLEEI